MPNLRTELQDLRPAASQPHAAWSRGRPGFSPTIGVVITTYQAAAYVDQALASIAGQTRPADRIVLVDDASTDATVARVRTWQRHLPIDLVVQPVNGGVARARNAGLARLDTDVVAILDGDDVLLPDHLQLLGDLHEVNGGIISPMAMFWTPGHAPRPYQRRLRGFVPPKDDQLRRLIHRNFVFVASVMSRFDIDAVGGFAEGDRAQDTTADWDLWLRLTAKGCHVTQGPFPTVLYRVHAGSMASDAGSLLRAEIQQLERARTFLPEHLETTVVEAIGNRRAELELLEDCAGSRFEQARRAVGPGGGDWRNRARALAGATAPGAAAKLLRRRGCW
ncbi:MAG: glycosyltransferase family 2 protein [Acidimicrobiia bacterium]